MRRSAQSSVTSATILPILCASLLIQSCANSPIKYTPPTPAAIHCASDVPADPLPPIPNPLTFDALQVWASQAIGVYRGEVEKRVTTAACLDAYRKRGVIR